MASKYKGEVEFQDSTGATFVLRLGTYQWMTNNDRLQKMLDAGKGRDYQCNLFHIALVNGSESQKKLTLEDAVELLDDIGYVRANELIEQTKFGRNVNEAQEHDKKEKQASAARAAIALMPKIDALNRDATDPDVKKALDEVVVAIKAMQNGTGSANPPEETTSSN